MSTLNGHTIQCSIVAEPTTCTIVTVAVIGHFSNLETEVLTGWSVGQRQKRPIQIAFSDEIAQTGVHDVHHP